MSTPQWTPLDPDNEAFLDAYDRLGAGGDPAALFAPQFLAVDPARAVSITAAMLAAALPARRGMFDAAGVGEIRRAQASQLRLDDRHVLIRADWVADRPGRDPLRLSASLLVRQEPAGPSILVYLNHLDVAAQLGTPA